MVMQEKIQGIRAHFSTSDFRGTRQELWFDRQEAAEQGERVLRAVFAQAHIGLRALPKELKILPTDTQPCNVKHRSKDGLYAIVQGGPSPGYGLLFEVPAARKRHVSDIICDLAPHISR